MDSQLSNVFRVHNNEHRETCLTPGSVQVIIDTLPDPYVQHNEPVLYYREGHGVASQLSYCTFVYLFKEGFLKPRVKFISFT